MWIYPGTGIYMYKNYIHVCTKIIQCLMLPNCPSKRPPLLGQISDVLIIYKIVKYYLIVSLSRESTPLITLSGHLIIAEMGRGGALLYA